LNNNFRMTKMAAALATAGLVSMPSLVFAAASTTTTAGTPAVFRAPVVGGTFTPAFGLQARHSVTRDGAAATLDGMEAVAFLYDAAGAYVGFVRGGYANKTSAATTATVTVPSAASGATSAVFGLFYHGDEAAAGTASDDTLNAVAANKSAILFVPTVGGGRTNFTPTYLDAFTANAAANVQTANGPTAAQLNTIGANATLVNLAANRVALDATYGGPVLSGAAKDALTPALVRLNFNAALADIADGVDVSATVQTRVGATIKGAPMNQDALGQGGTFNMAAGGSVFYVDNAGVAFADAVDTVTIAGSSATVTDEAGNSAKTNNAGVAITTFSTPAYSAAGTVGIISNNDLDAGNSLVQGAVSETNLYSAGGVRLVAGADTLTVSLRMSEAMAGGNWNAVDDVAVASGATDFPTSGWATANAGQTLTATVTPGAGSWVRVDTATGKLQYGGNGVAAGAFADITATVKKGASALTTLEGKALAADLAATSVFAGDPPPFSVLTNDADTDGRIDGVRVNYNAPLSALGVAPGFAIKTTGGTTPTLPSTFTVSANTVTGIITTPATADWNGNGTGNEAADNLIYTQANFSTGVTTTAKYTFGITSGTGSATYSSIFDAATGNLLQIPTQAQTNANFLDGAKPLVTVATFNTVQGTSPGSGNLVLVASEGLALSGPAPSGSQYSATGSPLTLLNLNDGLADVAFGALSTTTVANDTITITGVSANAAAKLLTIGTTPGYADGAANVVATAPAGVTIAAGTTVFTAPKLSQATAGRTGGGVGANINQIVLRLNKGVQLAPVGKLFNGNGVLVATTTATAPLEDGQFQVRANIPINGVATDVTISMRAVDVDLTQASTGFITLNIPAPGIIGTATTITVDYQNGVAAGARLVSLDPAPTGPVVFDVPNAAFFDGADADVLPDIDGNTITAALPVNSNKLLIQEMTGKVTLDGTAALENGSIVRADLVKFDFVTAVHRGTVRVPCDCTAGSQTVTLTTIDAGFPAAIDDARRLGQSSIRVYVTTTKDANTPSVVRASIQAAPFGGGTPAPVGVGGAATTQYEAEMNLATGAISSAGNQVSGSAVISANPALTILDTAFQVMTPTSAGVFRLSTGVNDRLAAEGAFRVVAVKRPTDTRFRMITCGGAVHQSRAVPSGTRGHRQCHRRQPRHGQPGQPDRHPGVGHRHLAVAADQGRAP